MYNKNFGIIFFSCEAKITVIALATARIFNEACGKKKPKFVIDNFVLALTRYTIKNKREKR